MNLSQYSEVIVDLKSGAIEKSDAIAGGSELKAAAEQSVVMFSAMASLENAVGNALRAFPGYRAVGAAPSLYNGRPIATTTLMKGKDVKTFVETLD